MTNSKNRNKPCPCGSGKKYKFCCLNKRKPRETMVVLDMGQPTKINGVGITHDNEIELFCDGVRVTPKSARLVTSYKREKGPKLLNRLDTNTQELLLDSHRVFEKYDLIYAIDTNTISIGEDIVSVTCIVLCKIERKKKGTLALFAPVHWLEFRNIQEKPENTVWRYMIEKMMTPHPAYNESWKIAMLVDSDLGDIPDYNAGKKPIIEDFYLPRNISLVYASADIGKEYLPNILISRCDKESKELIKYIKANPQDNFGLKRISNAPFTHLRSWNEEFVWEKKRDKRRNKGSG